MALVTSNVDQLRKWARLNASTCGCLAFVAVIAALSAAPHRLAVAVYALSFWHYYLYWLAYRHGAVSLAIFKRDAILMKSVALVLLGGVLLQAPVNVPSLILMAAGFSLNGLAAKVLGADRTYYGYELARLPALRIRSFPYSWISHPMLLGNVMAFGGTLLNQDFRLHWWPLAGCHVAANLGLLLMEVCVTPQRGHAADLGRPRASWSATADGLAIAIFCAAAGVAFGCWAAWQTGRLPGAIAGACVTLYAYSMYCLYVRAPACSARPHQPEEV